MAGSIERISLKHTKEGVSRETIALHVERYQFASQYVKGASVLDIACGAGYGSQLLFEQGGARGICGVDISPEAVEEAKADYASGSVHFFQSDYRNLAEPATLAEPLKQFAQANFDAIVSLETIEHLPDPDDFLSTILKCLKPGGIFVGSVPVTPSMDANPYHLQDFNPRSFRALLRRHGLQPFDELRQIQKFNPVTVRGEMNSGQRQGLRSNMKTYYRKHPGKLALRIWSTLTHGFTNHYDAVAARLHRRN